MASAYGAEAVQRPLPLRVANRLVEATAWRGDCLTATLGSLGIALDGLVVTGVATSGTAHAAGVREGAVLRQWHDRHMQGTVLLESVWEESPATFDVGFELRMEDVLGVEFEGCEVVSVQQGGPAARQGIPCGATVLSVNQIPVTGSDLQEVFSRQRGHTKLLLRPSPGARLSISPLPVTVEEHPGGLEGALREVLEQYGTVQWIESKECPASHLLPPWAAGWERRKTLAKADVLMDSSRSASAARAALHGFPLPASVAVEAEAEGGWCFPADVTQGPVQPCLVCVRSGDAPVPVDWPAEWWDSADVDHNCTLRGNVPTRQAATLRLTLTVTNTAPSSFASRTRMALLRLIHATWFGRAVLVLIVISSAALGLEAQQIDDINNDPDTGMASAIRYLDRTVFVLFFLEMLVKAIACGFIATRGAYLRNAWNVMDFAILAISSLDFIGTRQSGVYVLRLLRVMRPLRAVSRSSELKKLVHTLFTCAPLMFNVLSLLLFVMWIFAILGLELWKGAYHNRCYLQPYNITRELLLQQTGTPTQLLYALRDTSQEATGMPLTAGHHEVVINDSSACSMGSSGRVCEGSSLGQYCDELDTSLPFEYRVFNFDNIAHALLTVLKVISLDDWPMDMNNAQLVSGWGSWVYFISLTTIGTYFCINLFLAVLTALFVQEIQSKREFQRPLLHVTPAVSLGGSTLLPAAALAWVTRDFAGRRFPLLTSPWRVEAPEVCPAALRDEFLLRQRQTVTAPDSAAATAAVASALLGVVVAASTECDWDEGRVRVPGVLRLRVLCVSVNVAEMYTALVLCGTIHAHAATAEREPAGSAPPSPRAKAPAARHAALAVWRARVVVDVYDGVRRADRRVRTLNGVPVGCTPPSAANVQLQYTVRPGRDANKSVSMRLHIYGPRGESGDQITGIATHVVRWGDMVCAMQERVVQSVVLNDQGDLHGAEVTLSIGCSDVPDEGITAQEAALVVTSASWLGLELKEVLRRNREQNPPYSILFKICSKPLFNLFIVIVTLVNCIALAFDRYGIGQDGADRISTINLVCNIIFIVEAVIKIGGLWPLLYVAEGQRCSLSAIRLGAYFSDTFNVFELVLVILSVIDLMQVGIDVRSLAALRALRLVRVFRLFDRVQSFHKVLVTLADSAKSVAYLAVFMLLFVYTYAVLGVQLFNEKLPEGYNGLFEAMLSVFVVLTGDGWASEMKTVVIATTPYACMYHVVLFLVGSYVLVNLFVAILIENFASYGRGGEDEEEEEELEEELTAEELPPAVDEDDFVSALVSAAVAVLHVATEPDEEEPLCGGASPPVDDDAPRGCVPYGDEGSPSPPFRDGPKGTSPFALDFTTASKGGTISEDGTEARTASSSPRTPASFVAPEWVGAPPPADVLRSYVAWCRLQAALGLDGDLRDNPDAEVIALAAVMCAACSAGITACESKQQRRLAELMSVVPLDKLRPASFVGSDGFIDGFCVAAQDDMKALAARLHAANIGRTLNIFLPRSRARLCCKAILGSAYYYLAVFACVVINTVFCFMDSPTRRDANPSFTSWADTAEVLIFTLSIVEVVIKLVFFGAWGYRTSYFRSGQHQMEFGIVVATAVGLSGGWTGARALKSVRILRTIFWNEELITNVKALMMALPEILYVAAIAGVLWFMLAIIGVELFKGNYHYCQDEDPTRGTRKHMCAGLYNTTYQNMFGTWPTQANRTWTDLEYTFDDVGSAMFTIFKIAVGEGWANIMWDGVNARGPEAGFQSNAGLGKAVYFVVTVVVVQFVVINLFIGVLFDQFNTIRAKEEAKGYSRALSAKQRRWIEATRLILGAGNEVYMVAPERSKGSVVSSMRNTCYNVAQHSLFDLGVTMLLITNSALMATQHFEMPQTLTDFLEYANVVFVCLYSVEALLKLGGYGLKQYLAVSWNRFDFVVLLISIVSLFFDGPGTSSVRLFRVLRVLRLMKQASVLQSLIRALTMALPSLLNAVALLAIAFFVWGVFGVELWGRLKVESTHQLFSNFHDLGHAMVTLYEISTTEGWIDIMEWCSIEPPRCNESARECGSEGMANFYFILFLVVSGFIIINLFVAIIIEYFDLAQRYQNNLGTFSKIDAFKDAWAVLDPRNKMVIEARQLLRILRLQEPPIWLPPGHPAISHKGSVGSTAGSQFCNTMAQLRSLAIPVRDKRSGRGTCHVLFAQAAGALITRLVGCGMDDAAEASLVHRERFIPRIDAFNELLISHWYAADFIRANWVHFKATHRERRLVHELRRDDWRPGAAAPNPRTERALLRQQRFLLERMQTAAEEAEAGGTAPTVALDDAVIHTGNMEREVMTLPAGPVIVLSATPPSPVSAPLLDSSSPAPSPCVLQSTAAASTADDGGTTVSLSTNASTASPDLQAVSTRTRSGFVDAAAAWPPNPIAASFGKTQDVYSPLGSPAASPRVGWFRDRWPAPTPPASPARTAAARSSTAPYVPGPAGRWQQPQSGLAQGPAAVPDRGRLREVFHRMLEAAGSTSGRLSASAISMALLQSPESAQLRRDLRLPADTGPAADAITSLWLSPPASVAAAAASGGLTFEAFEDAVQVMARRREANSTASPTSPTGGMSPRAPPSSPAAVRRSMTQWPEAPRRRSFGGSSQRPQRSHSALRWAARPAALASDPDAPNAAAAAQIPQAARTATPESRTESESSAPAAAAAGPGTEPASPDPPATSVVPSLQPAPDPPVAAPPVRKPVRELSGQERDVLVRERGLRSAWASLRTPDPAPPTPQVPPSEGGSLESSMPKPQAAGAPGLSWWHRDAKT
eukprot:TRINITY_DN13758_c0_g1_i1.p1 TRINITY_DN13758_c0_g1~~TRINITY_DN13758_c0_g1_i1.p1  ORF type:complete len:3175 (+),score=1081.43 TRINITY_DN13758_c0_g1_i1:1209-9527(+)